MNVPECFQHIGVLRIGKYYKDLSRHEFSGAEKDFICLEAKKSTNEELLIDPFLASPRHPQTFTGMILQRYRMDREKFKSWQRSIRRGNHNRDGDKLGRPVSLDKISRINIKKTLIAAEKDVHPLSVQQTHELFVEQKIETLKRQKLDPNAVLIDKYNTFISPKTIAYVKKQPDMRIFDRVPQDLTEARLLALKCYRLAYISMCFIWGLCRNLPAVCKWNADCTTFECKPNGSGRLVCVVREKGVNFQVLRPIFLYRNNGSYRLNRSLLLIRLEI